MGLRGRPTLQTLVAIGFVFLLQQLSGLLGLDGYALFVLDPTVAARPWAAVTSIYAHTSTGHLFANAVALALAGPLVAWRTSVTRFHAFFVAVGGVAGLAEVFLGTLVGPPTAVVGASGAIFGLFGYLLTGNSVNAGLFDRLNLSRRGQLLLLLGVAVLVTLATASPRAALIGHAVGFLCGLVAGRTRLLDLTSRSQPRSRIESGR
jgi:membrane associated rhomboid family serine protease